MLCDICLKETCAYQEYSEECQETRILCDFCDSHCEGDTIYELTDYVNSFTFTPISGIKYCPCCGRKLMRG